MDGVVMATSSRMKPMRSEAAEASALRLKLHRELDDLLNASDVDPDEKMFCDARDALDRATLSPMPNTLKARQIVQEVAAELTRRRTATIRERPPAGEIVHIEPAPGHMVNCLPCGRRWFGDVRFVSRGQPRCPYCTRVGLAMGNVSGLGGSEHADDDVAAGPYLDALVELVAEGQDANQREAERIRFHLSPRS